MNCTNKIRLSKVRKFPTEDNLPHIDGVYKLIASEITQAIKDYAESTRVVRYKILGNKTESYFQVFNDELLEEFLALPRIQHLGLNMGMLRQEFYKAKQMGYNKYLYTNLQKASPDVKKYISKDYIAHGTLRHDMKLGTGGGKPKNKNKY